MTLPPPPRDSGSPAPNDGRGEHDTFVAFLKDNLEAIAVAVVMALVIKHFCVEAFKIPTSSMVPTLYGDGDDPLHPRNKGDRILVDKFAYLTQPPRRWDIPVFRYPLNRARNFIKRIVGLPGERLRISSDGDIWVRPAGEAGSDADLRIPQKRRAVREQFYRRVYPPPADTAPEDGEHDPRASLQRYWRLDEGLPSAWRLERHGLLVFAGGPRGVLRNAAQIGTVSSPDTWSVSSSVGTLVRDVRFRCRVRLDALAGEAPKEATRFSLAWRPDDEIQAVVALSTDAAESRAFIRRGTFRIEDRPLDLALRHGGQVEVELEYVDGMLYVHVDGSERAALPDGRRFVDTIATGSEQRFAITAEGRGLSVEDLVIDRDQLYVNEWTGNAAAERNGLDIPADHYFMLGDNVRNSADSRRWQVVSTWLRGGRVIRRDKQESVDYLRDAEGAYDRKRCVDVDGVVQIWSESDEDGERGSTTSAAPFVHRELIVGRAFLGFWPVFPDFPGRLGFIR